MAKLTSDLIRGHTDTMVLKLLQEKDMYGYEIVKEIFKRSDNQYELKEITLYSSLKRLQTDKYIISYWGDESKGGRRKYYNITDSGNELYKTKRENWEYSKDVLDKLL
jgi:PadR family transcriptional regulator PadR